MSIPDLFEAIVRHPLESLVTAFMMTFLIMIYTTLTPLAADGPFTEEFHTIFSVSILSIELIAAAGTLGLIFVIWKTFADLTGSRR